MSIAIPMILFGVMALVAVVAIYYLLRSNQERSDRASFLYKYGAYFPIALILVGVIAFFLIK
jgi:hypothetical protein